jgi:hypothetical protein
MFSNASKKSSNSSFYTELLFTGLYYILIEKYNNKTNHMEKLEQTLVEFDQALNSASPKNPTTAKSLWAFALINSAELFSAQEEKYFSEREIIAGRAIVDLVAHLNEGGKITTGDFAHKAIKLAIEKINKI